MLGHLYLFFPEMEGVNAEISYFRILGRPTLAFQDSNSSMFE
jgi:hypothetical protein